MSNELLRTVPRMKYIILPMLLLFHTILIAQDVEQMIKARPLNWTGTVGTSLANQPKRGKMNVGSPWHYSVYGNINLSFFETFNLPLTFCITRFGLNGEKPFYQLGISPTYKWIKLHLGHSNMHFNNYTLAGHTFFGAGIELTPKNYVLLPSEAA